MTSLLAYAIIRYQMKKERKEVKTMLELKQTGKNWFNIVDDGGSFVSGTKEELEELCQQIGKIKDGLPQEKANTHIVILENDCTNEKVQMELSDSAYELLSYLYEEYWLDSDDIRLTEVDEVNFEKFL